MKIYLSFQLIKEFIRLGPSVADLDIKKSFLKNLDKYQGPILKLTKGRKGAQKAEEVIQRQAAMRSEQEREGIYYTTSI